MWRTLLFCVFVMYGSPASAQHRAVWDSSVATPDLMRAMHAARKDEQLLVWVVFKKPPAALLSNIVSKQVQSNTYLLRIKAAEVKNYLESGLVAFADKYEKPKEELTTGSLDLATNRANYSHHAFPQINGKGVLVSVKENSVDSNDIDLVNRYQRTGAVAPIVTAHASIMATTIAGGGNSSPEAKGVAYASKITSADFSSLLPEEGDFYRRHGISVQNHSYGTIVQPYYGAEALAYDVNGITNRGLVSVFSAGNSGTATPASGLYSGITGFGNLTGNFKLAKNIITVGAIDSFYTVSPLSSAGPAYDGRIKPEIVAFGEDGSSGAAAMVSGAAALVQQAYKTTYNTEPSASLVKAVLVNSADEVGLVGPDFRSGYGSLNVHNAVATVMNGRAGEDSVIQGATKTFVITVPEVSAHLKITVSWTDSPAPAGAAKALVNNLDAKISSGSGQTWFPWLLNSAPNRDSLLLAPSTGIDTLNNLEQILIENPAAGTYTVEVAGAKVTGTQAYSFAYDIEAKTAFAFTYPGSDDPLEAGSPSVVRWETARKEGGTLQWSGDGASWTTIVTLPTLNPGYAKWTVPGVSTTAQLRMLFTDGSSAVSDSFVISPALKMTAGYDCADSFLLHWNGTRAGQYLLYELRGDYLQPFTTQPDTFQVLSKSSHPLPYYAVVALVAGKTGKRSFTLNYGGAGAGCYVTAFFLQAQMPTSATFQLTLGTTYGIRTVVFQKFVKGAFQNLSVIDAPTELAFSFNDDSLAQGENRYRVQIGLQNGQVLFSEVLTVYHLAQGNVLLYPNPVAQGGTLNVVTNKAGQITLEFIDITGNSVLKFRLPNLHRAMPASLLPKGLYHVRIIEDGGITTTQKLVVY